MKTNEKNVTKTTKKVDLFKNIYLQFITGMALVFISLPLILYVWYGINEFNTVLCVLWATSIVWLIMFVYANVFSKPKK